MTVITLPETGNTTIQPIYRQSAKVQQLADWEWRLLAKARELRFGQKSAMLLVTFSGPAMTLWRMTPDGRVE